MLRFLLAIGLLCMAACASEELPSCEDSIEVKDDGCFELLAWSEGEEELVYDLAWSPTDPLILTGSTTLLRLYRLDEDSASLQLVDSVSQEQRFNSVLWFDDGGHALATSGDRLRLFAVDAGLGTIEERSTTEANPAELQRVSLAEDGALALTCDQDGGLTLHGIDLGSETLTTLDRIDVHSRCTRVSLSADGALALSVGHDGLLALTAVDSEQGSLRLVDTIQGAEETGEAIFAPGDTHAYAGTFGVANELWEVDVDHSAETLAIRRVLCDHASGLGAMEVSHDGRWLLTGAHDDVMHLYARADGDGSLSPVARQDADGMGVHSARWSPDDRLVARTASNVDRLFVYRLGNCVQP